MGAGEGGNSILKKEKNAKSGQLWTTSGQSWGSVSSVLNPSEMNY